MTIEQLYEIYKQYPQIQTDTRKVQSRDIFFALKGANFNGNNFALEALAKGAVFAVIDEPIDAKNERLILVPDVLTTLQQLALHHRKQFTIPFIAITGSNGKTTTKELVFAVLNSRYKTYCTQGNLNNHIGIPLTILSIGFDAEIAIIEMGANHQKEIESYCQYTLPTHGIITNCGKAHLEGFGGVEGVKKGKGELYNFIQQTQGTIFLYDDYDYLHQMSNGITNLVVYGTQKGLVQGKVIQAEPFLQVDVHIGDEHFVVDTHLVGNYNLPNVLCAITTGKYFNIDSLTIKKAIENYLPTNSRSQLLQLNGNHIILDAYNANPTSMKAAIQNFAALHAAHKIVMIGGMMELGVDSKQEHQQIIHLLQQYQWQQVVLVGGDFKEVEHTYMYFDNAILAKQWFDAQHMTEVYILIKGSRSMQMEKIIG